MLSSPGLVVKSEFYSLEFVRLEFRKCSFSSESGFATRVITVAFSEFHSCFRWPQSYVATILPKKPGRNKLEKPTNTIPL